jgi:hypothetical protein
MDNVLRVCNNGSGGDEDDKCSDLGGGCSDGDGEVEDDDDGGNGSEDDSGDSGGEFVSITKLSL